MPNASAHIPNDSELWEKITSKAKSKHDGKVSAYVRTLLERDLSNDSSEPDALASTVLTDLAKRLCGELDAAALKEWLGDADQRHVLRGAIDLLLSGDIPIQDLISREYRIKKLLRDFIPPAGALPHVSSPITRKAVHEPAASILGSIKRDTAPEAKVLEAEKARRKTQVQAS